MERLDTPAVVVDLDIMEANIAAMSGFCRRAGIKLRPHLKAHKIPAIALKQLAAGAVGVTVAKLREAEAALEAGITNIFIAYQVVGEFKMRRLLSLLDRGNITVAVDGLQGARLLAGALRARRKRLPVLIEVNSGLDRCGVLPGEETLDLARRLVEMPELELKGIFTHAGQAYGACSPADVAGIGGHEGDVMVKTAALLRRSGIPVEQVSVGSTPTARFAGLVKGVTEIRPGNYVFHDAIQVGLGAASPEQCALTVAATVISKPAPGRIIIDAGSKTFALDRGAHGSEVVSGFGMIKNYSGLELTRLSEEHGIIENRAGGGEGPEIGEQLEIIPNHACVVVNLVDLVTVTSGGRVVDRWPVAARGS